MSSSLLEIRAARTSALAEPSNPEENTRKSKEPSGVLYLRSFAKYQVTEGVSTIFTGMIFLRETSSDTKESSLGIKGLLGGRAISA